MDFSTISTMLSSIKTATDIAKFIKESDASLEKAEFKLKLAELVSALADTKIQASEIQELLIDKDTKIKELEDRLTIRDKLEWEQPYYWLLKGNQKEGPYCQHCYDSKAKLIRLQGNGEGYWECMACKNSYTDSTYKSGIAVARTRSGIDWSAY